MNKTLWAFQNHDWLFDTNNSNIIRLVEEETDISILKKCLIMTHTDHSMIRSVIIRRMIVLDALKK